MEPHPCASEGCTELTTNEPGGPMFGRCRACAHARLFAMGSCRECLAFIVAEEFSDKSEEEQHAPTCSLRSDPDPFPRTEEELCDVELRRPS